MAMRIPATPARWTGRLLGSSLKSAVGEWWTVTGWLPPLNVSVNRSPETTADAIEVGCGGDGELGIGEAIAEGGPVGEVCAARGVVTPHAHKSARASAATTRCE